MAYRVLIYEDNHRLRQSLEILLNDEQLFKVAGAFPDCNKAAEEVIGMAAELVVMDIDMPGIGGVEGVKQIKQAAPLTKVVMHTMFDDDNRIFDSICAGADGYLLKNTSPMQLITALQEVMQGGAPMSPFVAQKVFQFFRNQQQPVSDFNLTNRETMILELLVKGNSYKMIADKSNVTIDTVKKHLQNIYHKLHVNCGTEAVAKALQHKIIRLD
ncbi:MAG: response regulator transcription factor [Chitinophagaceae bacterium]|nr:response regulator transcription factor [Chitinophagaceae bacterium]